MRFSEERIRHLSHLILTMMEKEKCIGAGGSGPVLHEIKRALLHYYTTEDQVDDIIRKKIHSYSRIIPEGSREWDVMYDKLFAEEMSKRGEPS